MQRMFKAERKSNGNQVQYGKLRHRGKLVILRNILKRGKIVISSNLSERPAERAVGRSIGGGRSDAVAGREIVLSRYAVEKSRFLLYEAEKKRPSCE